jgi:hypothetical protein
MKIIFLDIDGVLNVIPQGHDEWGGIFHKHFVDNLKWIIEETNAKIVISSSWRFSGLQSMIDMWKERKYPGEIIDITPWNLPNVNPKLGFYQRLERGHEIEDWLNRHPNVTNYVILDDDSDMLPTQMNYFVKCSENIHHLDCIDYGYGLTKECSQQSINILNK